MRLTKIVIIVIAFISLISVICFFSIMYMNRPVVSQESAASEESATEDTYNAELEANFISPLLNVSPYNASAVEERIGLEILQI